MLAIGSYFLFIMSVMGTTFAGHTFSVEQSDEFFENILNKHNEYRNMHHDSPLFLYRLAVDGAKKNLREWMNNTLNFQKQPGMNTFSIEFSENSPLDADLANKIVTEWYETGEGYNYDVEPTSNTADPFTQVVWKNSQQLGVAVGVENYKLYVLTYYIPKGNQKNEYIENVPKLK